jgi:hypothetical protein
MGHSILSRTLLELNQKARRPMTTMETTIWTVVEVVVILDILWVAIVPKFLVYESI